MSKGKPPEIKASEFAERCKYKVESGIPLPKTQSVKAGNRNTRERWLYPLRVMEVGQSFFVPAADHAETKNGWLSISQAINGAQQREDKRFCWRTRTLAEHGEEGWRVWRTK